MILDHAAEALRRVLYSLPPGSSIRLETLEKRAHLTREQTVQAMRRMSDKPPLTSVPGSKMPLRGDGRRG